MRRAAGPLAALVLAGCAPSAPPNVVLIVVDALRASRLGVYGADRPTSPALDAFARGAVVFDRAYATAPWTKPSVASILTGRYPQSHGVKSWQHRLGGTPTLPERLRGHGYRTAGMVANPFLTAKAGFARGFDVFLDDQARGLDYVSTEGLTAEATAHLEGLAAAPRPFFLYLHYFDPHDDYRRHPDVGFAPPSAGRLRGDEPAVRLRTLDPPLAGDEVEFVRAEYDEEVRHTDQGLAVLFARLRALGLWDRTLIVVTADHGEELHERGFFGHARTLYEELVRVPLLVKPPVPSPVPRRVEAPVSLASLVPTILELTGSAVGPTTWPAPSLAPALNGAAVGPTEVLSEVDFVPFGPRGPIGHVHKKALIAEDLKLIRDDPTRSFELYDLRRDPAELHDLAGRRGLVRRLGRRLERLLQAQRAGAARSEEQPMSHEDLERLRALGYVGH